MHSIYKALNLKNGRVYIGQTKYPIYTRIKRHLCSAKRNSNCKFHKAIRKYGIEAFSISLLEDVHQNIVSIAEQMWIALFDSYRSGYNETIGGDGVICCKHSAEVRKKNSERNMGELNPRFGIKWSDVEKFEQSKRLTGANNPRYNKSWPKYCCINCRKIIAINGIKQHEESH